MRSYVYILLFAITLQYVCAYELPGIDKRQQTCVTCPLITPPCPVCPSGSECQIISQSCTQCAQAQCISSTSLNNLAGNGQAAPAQSNMGAIAGGIVGALVAVGCIAGALFWYIRRKRRATEERDMWLENSKNIEEEEKDPRQTASIHTHGSSGNPLHHSIASTTMTHASNVIPIGFNPSPLRSTMMSTDTGFSGSMHHDSMASLPSPRSHPPTQFFSADDILRNSLATTNRDTRYSDRDTMYSSNRDTRYTNRDSTATTMTRASIATTAYRSTAIIAAAPVPVAVRAQPKIITFKQTTPPSPIPAVPTLTAEKVAEAERRANTTSLAIPVPPKTPSPRLPSVTPSPRSSNTGLGLNIPITIQPSTTPRLSTISSVTSPTATPPVSSPFDDTPELPMPESPILGDAEDLMRHPSTMDLRIMLTPTSAISPSIFDDVIAEHETEGVSDDKEGRK